MPTRGGAAPSGDPAAGGRAGKPLLDSSAWAAGCSSGEEAYTPAMLLAEEAEAARKQFDMKIFATDTAEKPLNHARAGLYPAGIEGDLDPERIDRFFDKDDHLAADQKTDSRDGRVRAAEPADRSAVLAARRRPAGICSSIWSPRRSARVIALLHFSPREGGRAVSGELWRRRARPKSCSWP